MAGLVTMDLHTIFKRKIFVLLMVVMGWLLGVMGANSFVVGYLTMLGSMLVVSGLNYDFMDGGLSFIFTMPIDAKIYAIEKYFLGIFCGTVSWFMGLGFLFIGCVMKGQPLGEMAQYLVLIPAVIIMVSAMIPLEIKYGAEKSRFVLLLGVGILFAAVYLTDKVFGKTDEALEFLNGLNEATIILATFVFAFVICIISVFRSISILKNKEL